MGADRQGYTRYDNERIKEVIGPHVAKLVNETFGTELNFTAASAQFMAAKTQDSNIQFTKDSVNSIEEVGNVIICKIVASGLHTLTFSDDFVLARNDFAGLAGTFYLFFNYMIDGKIMTTVVQDA